MSIAADPTEGDDRGTPPASEPAAPAAMAQPSPRWQRTYLAVCCAIIGSAIAYWLPHWAELPVLCYVPLERRWTWSPPTTTPVITYLGLVLWGSGGCAVGALLGTLLGTVVRRPLSTPALRLFGAWAISAFVLTGWYYTWNLWPF